MAFVEVIGTAVRRAKTGRRLFGGLSRAIIARSRDRSRPVSSPNFTQSLCPEADCIRNLLPRRVIAAAERRAQAVGTGADRVLICADAITEETYLSALATSLDTSYDPLDRIARADCPLDDRGLIEAATSGVLPLREAGKLVWIIAPRGLTARQLAEQRGRQRKSFRPFRLTANERLLHFVMRHTEKTLGKRAAEELRRTRPHFSSAPRQHGWGILGAALFMALAATILAITPAATIDSIGTLLCAIFLAAAVLRLSSAIYRRRMAKPAPRIADNKLPVYTIICALYRESAVVGDLVAAIRALDYPPEKLDVKFVVEADDWITKRALAKLDLGAPFEIITAPPIGPRTKPKALNVALPLARGKFTVVYDAEDAPEPDQLRCAVGIFRRSGYRLACLQASLTIDNTSDSWLVRMFTANYAGQFDVFLPGLAALRLPFPLGGSSNHFRTSVLRKIGGWDPYNVTEDADLGIRLHRCGYRSAMLPSTTYEEAPAHLVPWLKQRTRWYKGWMQTWLVHVRRPWRLLRDLKPAGAFAFQLLLACNVLAALVHPIFMAILCYLLLTRSPLHAFNGMGGAAPIFLATLFCGYATNVVLDWIGLQRRGLLAHAWVLAMTPIYWLLLSLAAWRALIQLLHDPQRWEKTEHGLAKNSRRSAPQKSNDACVGKSPIALMNAVGPATGTLSAHRRGIIRLHRRDYSDIRAAHDLRSP